MENERKGEKDVERELAKRSNDRKRQSSGSTPEEDLMDRGLDVAHEKDEIPGEGAAEGAGEMDDAGSNPP